MVPGVPWRGNGGPRATPGVSTSAAELAGRRGWDPPRCPWFPPRVQVLQQLVVVGGGECERAVSLSSPRRSWSPEPRV